MGRLSPWVLGLIMLVLAAAVSTASWLANDGQGAPEASVFLVSMDLADDDLAAARLPGAQLMGTNLDGVDLSGADLRGADLSRTIGDAPILAAACLTDTRWDASRLTDVVLDGADLRGADLRSALITINSADGAAYDAATTWPAAGVPAGAVRSENANGSPCRG